MTHPHRTMKRLRVSALVPALVLLVMDPVSAVGPSFRPDVTFEGSNLQGWQVLGQAEWRAEDGDLIGTATGDGSGGWLVLDQSYQEAEFVPDLIHNRSGVGSDVLAADLNTDGAIDVVTSTDRGTFVFWGRPR